MKEYIEKGYPIKTSIQLKEGISTTAGCVAIVKGHKAPLELIHMFVNQALDAQAQLGIAKDFWYSPTNTKVKVPDDLKHSVLAADGTGAKVLPIDLNAFAIEKLNKAFCNEHGRNDRGGGPQGPAPTVFQEGPCRTSNSRGPNTNSATSGRGR
jgi:hypothetical protein